MRYNYTKLKHNVIVSLERGKRKGKKEERFEEKKKTRQDKTNKLFKKNKNAKE